MNNTEKSKPKLTRTVFVLRFVVCSLAAIIALGTIIGLVRGKNTPLIGGSGAEQTAAGSILDDDIRIFSGIGRLRIPLVDSSVLILSIAFPYQASDIAFSEELAGKINDFKTIAINYFTALPEDRIINIDEEAAKKEILDQFNSILRLGRISVLYFNDLMIIGAP